MDFMLMNLKKVKEKIFFYKLFGYINIIQYFLLIYKSLVIYIKYLIYKKISK